MKRILGAAVVVLALWAGQASAALTWNVVRNADCTGLAAATGVSSATTACCTAAGNGHCDRREVEGSLFVRYFTMGVPGAAAYTAAGDALDATALSRIGLGTIIKMQCDFTSGGYQVLPVRTSVTNGFKIALKESNDAAAGADGPLQDVVGSVANQTTNCVAWGH